MQHNFQVNLGGIIDILANHLYSDESVFIRELLQNATDAITARIKTGENFEPEIEVELINDDESNLQLIVSENGIGLTEQDVHSFLSIIGNSSKKDELLKKKDDFIGQFGIGLLSCFMVAEEIVLISKSAKSQQAVKWVGKADGTYTLQVIDGDFNIGTKVFLTAKHDDEKDIEQYFEYAELKEQILHYGNFLPYPIHLINNSKKVKSINDIDFPWEKEFKNEKEKKKSILKFAEEYFLEKFIDCLPLLAPDSKTQGYAFVSANAIALNEEQKNGLYLHRMLLSTQSNNVLPNWVFFVKCIINTQGLRPTASRENFYEDKLLDKTKDQLGQCIIDYLENLKKQDEKLLKTIIHHHDIAFKYAAKNNDNFFKLIHKFLSFETTQGRLSIDELINKKSNIKYVVDVDEYYKIAGVANSQGSLLLNAGYVYEDAFFEKLSQLYPKYPFHQYNANDLILELDSLEVDEEKNASHFKQIAESVLLEFSCSMELKKFLPKEMPAIFFKNDDMNFLRNIETSKSNMNNFWDEILDNFSEEVKEKAVSKICFNQNNHLVKKMQRSTNDYDLSIMIRVLYVQSLLLGRHSLQQNELSTLTNSLSYLLQKITELDGK